MHLYTMVDALLYKVFLITLQNVAHKWYLGLEEGSIKSFSQLATLFKVRFVTSIPTKRVSTDLQKVVQEDGESLRSYISHFNKVAMQIENLSHTEALTCSIVLRMAN